MSYPSSDSHWLVIEPWFNFFLTPFYWPIDLWHSYREKRAFAAGIETAWDYCASVWDRPYVEVWSQLIHTSRRPSWPHSTCLVNHFRKAFSESYDFLAKQARSKNPVLATYAVQCFADPNLVPAEVRERTETIQLRDWFHIVHMPLGEWTQRFIESHNRSVELLQSWDKEE